ncbi:MAG: MFS transporter [Chloroflexota bacterium]|nr:MFS transporter [Chloroflexota bacterium]
MPTPTMIEQQAFAEPRASMMDVLRNRDFLKLWGAQITSQTAQQIVNIALVLQVSALTSSSTATAGIVICFTVPAILFAAIAGVFVERHSKKMILVLTNVGRGLAVLGYLLTDTRWGAGAVLPIFYVTTLVFSSVSQFFNPAEASLIPLLVKKEELVHANSIFNLTLPATQLGGFVLLGPLLLATIFHHNYNGLYLVIVVLCLIAAALTFFLPTDHPSGAAAPAIRAEEEENQGSHAVTRGTSAAEGAGNGNGDSNANGGFKVALDELVEGARFIRRDPVIVSAIIYWSIAIAVFMMLGTIGPLFLRNVLNIDQSRLLFILVPGGVGLVLGVVAVGRVSHPGNRETMINWGLLAAGITLVLFSIADPILNWAYKLSHHKPSETLVLGLMGFITLLLGLSNSFISVPAQTALQERSPEEIRARVFSAFYTVQNVVLIVPVLLAGVVADTFGYVPTVAGIGVIVMLVAGFGLYSMRKRQSSALAPSAGSALSAPAVIPPPTAAPDAAHHPEDARGATVRKPTLEEKSAAVMVAAPTPRHMPPADHPDETGKLKRP